MRFLAMMNTTGGRILRVGVGLAMAISGVLGGGIGGVALALMAIPMAGTAILGICPLNPLLGQPMRACAIPHTRRPR